MNKYISTFIFVLLASISGLSAQDWNLVLLSSEKFRAFSDDGFSFDYALKEQEQESTASMRVFVKPQDPLTVAVKYLTPERYENRRVLVGAGGFWLMDRGMNSPLRISPQQMLFGQAAAGDITRVSFSLQYDIRTGEEKEGEVVLELQKKSQSDVSFPRVRLILEPGVYKPRKAEFYSDSGQLSKSILYEKYGTVEGREMVLGFRIINELNHQETWVQLGGYKKIRLGNQYFTRTGFGKIP